MLTTEGYKMFRGIGKINGCGAFCQKYIYGDWLYKPECDCWYVKGCSFPASIVEIVEDKTEGIE